MLINHLSINNLLHELTILKFLVTYRTTITLNLIRLLEGELVYYEQINIATKHIYLIIVPLSFRHIGTLVSIKPYTVFASDFLAWKTFWYC